MKHLLVKLVVCQFLWAVLVASTSTACTIFVFTHNGKTYFCNNEDWRDPITQIRFIPAKEGSYAWVYFGFSNDWAQGGVNEHGLSFDWFASGGPFGWKSDPVKSNFDGNLSEELLRKCKNVDEVIAFYQRYNEENLDNAVTLIADKAGNSLLVHWHDGRLVLEKNVGRLHSCGVGKQKVDTILQNPGSEFRMSMLTDALRASITEGEFATKYSSVISLSDGKIVLFQERNYDQYIEIDIAIRLRQPASTCLIADLFQAKEHQLGITLKCRDLKKAPETGLIVGWDGEGAKILRVLRGRTDMQMFGSLESGVEGRVNEGEYIRSVNSKPITETVGFDELTVGIKATDLVLLEVSETATGPTRKVEVRFLVPDVEVELIPKLEFSIQDEQLQRAVNGLLAEMDRTTVKPQVWPEAFSTPFESKQTDKFRFLDDRLNKVRIVGFGEDTHGTAEFTEMAVDLMIYLSEKHGFRVFIIENGFGETTCLNDYINGRLDHAEAILQKKISTWRYQTIQFVDLLNKLRDYNRNHLDQPIQIFGMEMHYPLEESRKLNQFLAKGGLAPLSAAFDKTLYQPTSNQEKVDCFIACHKAKQDLLDQKDLLISRTCQQDYDDAMMCVTIIGQYVSAINQEHEQLRNDLRDLYMEVNVAQILAMSGTDSKALVWAHNAHIGDWVSNGIVDVLGHQLKKRYGSAYFNLATHFGVGSYLAFPHNANETGWKLTTIPRDSIDRSSLTHRLSELGKPNVFVDCRRVREDPRWKCLMQEPVIIMSGGGAQAHGTMTEKVDLGAAFDGVVFLGESSPIKLLK